MPPFNPAKPKIRFQLAFDEGSWPAAVAFLGSGRRLFPDGATPADLRLVDSVTTTTGVIIATYRPA